MQCEMSQRRGGARRERSLSLFPCLAGWLDILLAMTGSERRAPPHLAEPFCSLAWGRKYSRLKKALGRKNIGEDHSQAVTDDMVSRLRWVDAPPIELLVKSADRCSDGLLHPQASRRKVAPALEHPLQQEILRKLCHDAPFIWNRGKKPSWQSCPR